MTASMQEPVTSVESSSSSSSSATTSNIGAAVELPQCFHVRYLGFRSAQGLWGIKYTRNPVDDMVATVKACQETLHLMKFFVKKNGCKLESVYNGKIETRFFPIDVISYGVQDLVYTRVFAMIVVRQETTASIGPYECHAFVCDSRQSARKLTYALASSFQEYSKELRATRSHFAIDLRPSDEIDKESKCTDSEA